MEPHGTIIAGRWKGTRGSLVMRDQERELVVIRPFNDTAETEDSRMHLSPAFPIRIPAGCWEEDPL